MHSPVVLYQFTLCPFCNKVRAALDLKGVKYKMIEVNPRTKVELPELPNVAPRKVPVLRIGDEVLFDSTDILMALDTYFPESAPLLPEDEVARSKTEEIEDWVDEQFIRALPTVIYGTWSNAARAARMIGREGNFSFLEGMGVKYGGTFVMRLVAGRILKKEGREDGHAWVEECLDQFEGWLGDADFVCGDTMTMADAAMFGGIACVSDFPVYTQILRRPRIAAWHERMVGLQSRAAA